MPSKNINLFTNCTQYFNDIIINSTKNNQEDEENSGDLSVELVAAHELILDIFSVSPPILMSVIPQLEEELKVDDLQLRMLSMTTLGRMFCKSSKLASVYEGCWAAWMDRRKDKCTQIRIQWIKMCGGMLESGKTVSKEVYTGLEGKLSDPDEKVRQAAVRIFGDMNVSNLQSVPIDCLQSIYERCKDKKVSVRNEAMNVLASIYRMGYQKL